MNVLDFVGLPLFLPLKTRASQQMVGEVRGGGRKAVRKAAVRRYPYLLICFQNVALVLNYFYKKRQSEKNNPGGLSCWPR